MTDEPKKMLTLGEEVAKLLAAAPKPLALAGVKKGLEAAGVPTGKGGVTKAQLEAALAGEGVYQHPAKTADGKPSYWHLPPRSAEEIAAEAAEKEAKVAAAAKAKADAQAAKEAEAARKAAEKEAKAAAVVSAKLAKEEAAARKIAEKEAKDAAAAAAKLAKEEAAARKAAEKETKAAAAAAEKAAKEEAAARKIAEKEAKPFRLLAEKVHAKVLQLGDKLAPLSKLAQPNAKAKPELHAEFDRIIKTLLDDKKLFEHPGGKYGRKPYEPPVPPKWYETKAAKAKIKKLVDAAKVVLAIDGATLEDVLPLIQQAWGETANDSTAPEPSTVRTETPHDLPLSEFASKVLAIIRHSPTQDQFLGDGVYISAAYHAAQSTAGFPKMELGEFKEKLLEANRHHLLHLSRIDLTGEADPDKLAESRTKTEYTTFDLIDPTPKGG